MRCLQVQHPHSRFKAPRVYLSGVEQQRPQLKEGADAISLQVCLF